MNKDKVLLIIASFNGQKYWPDLLPALAKEQYTDFDLEVLVVDNNSTDSSVEYIKAHYPQFTLIKLPNNSGFVGANNVGYEYAKKIKAQYIYLLNQDTIINTGWLQPLYVFAKKNKFGSLQSKINLWPESRKINTLGNPIHFLGFGYSWKMGELDTHDYPVRKINYASGAGVFISMEALEKLGYLFDDSMFLYLEDLDLGWSLQLLGYDNYLIPESQIFHKYQFNKSYQQVYWFERNRLWVCLKNYHILSLIVLFPAWFLMEFGQLLFAVRNHYFSKKIKAYSFIFSFKGWRKLLQKRRLIQSKRVRKDRQVVTNFSGQILFQPLANPFLKLANIFFNIYWQIVRLLIFW